ncbi:MAG: methyltransferase domain-containing protein [Gomphosphaeria aponina SAG 52.96 = DSM 107014]|uniref:Methyltransferase domain-containing protein n=1 Tax=Gomphosphaeria aponina SAG 52.96 = DSM 107014 TaxID=1521640 RepID=A0A941GLW3_9CHRO|nr:methyltransferase domain-containing protein [Gomphosphaeria aponina SAG 52.96 = DSM 107014]
MNFKKVVKSVLKLMGYTISPKYKQKKSTYYINASETVKAAKAQGKTVREYVEELWEQKGCTEKVIQEMKQIGALEQCDRICEIGPGTGRYLDLILLQVVPKKYEIYEVADDWAQWLVKNYAPTVILQQTDGKSLKDTPDNSCDLVHAHGVFVYLPFLHCFEYFLEMTKICKQNGYVVFDFYADEDFDCTVIDNWLNYADRYPVILPRKTVIKYFENLGFKLISEFKNKHGHSHSHYVMFQKIN